MAKKKYSFVVEKIYRTKVEGEFDLEEIRKNNERIAHWTDEEILMNMAELYGVYDESNGAEYDLEETNVRTIYDIDSKEVIYED